jgi:hypothetical protein
LPANGDCCSTQHRIPARPDAAWGLAWAGLFNTYFWPDPNKRVTGTTMTQLLPFADDQS